MNKSKIILLSAFVICILFYSICNIETNNTAENSEYTKPSTDSIIITEETEESKTEEGRTYIINTNSGKIHYIWCYSVDIMKDSNKKYIVDTIENLIDKGYSPCGNCKPY